jgi:hypothetical protein
MDVEARGTSELTRTAKSCGPDTPTLVSKSAETLTTVANKPGTPGRARSKL